MNAGAGRPGETDRLCPRCRIALFEGRIAESSLLGCGACGGVWLDVAASQAVVLGAARDLTTLAEQASSRATVTPDRAGGGLSCPSCGAALARVRVAGTDVELDSCTLHGTWFDAGELRVVELAYARLPAPLRFRPEDYETLEERRAWLTPNICGWELDKRGKWIYIDPALDPRRIRNGNLGSSDDNDLADAAAVVDGVISFVHGVVRGLTSGR